MNHSRVELQGLAELRAALRQLPADLAREAGAIVTAHAEEAGRAVREGYPEGPTGNLRHRVTVDAQQAGLFSAAAIVRSRAPHAQLWERGTKARRTDRGWNRGRMPQPPAGERAIPKFSRARAKMRAALIDLVRRAGFEVHES